MSKNRLRSASPNTQQMINSNLAKERSDQIKQKNMNGIANSSMKLKGRMNQMPGAGMMNVIRPNTDNNLTNGPSK